MKKAKIILFVTGFCMLIGFYFYPKTKAEQAFHDFQTTQHKEAFIVAPLCAAGEKVVPIVLEEIQNKELERRVYAIGFLGSDKFTQAIPVLEKLIDDKSESESIKANSLKAIFLINKSKGLEIAEKYKNKKGYLGETSSEVLKVKDYIQYKLRNNNCDLTDA